MPAIYTKPLRVTPDTIDANRHVNNLTYMQWMQDIATEHSAAQGWDMARYFEAGVTWVVRSHFIEYLRPAFEGELLVGHTWISDVLKRRSTRRYAFVREGDGAIVARAETLWVFVEFASGRPTDIPDLVRADFPVVPVDDPALAGLGRAHSREART
jgi:acyl-CoA thioester hydrolase